ncbi:hypothetical protein SESBI_04786 [Sesbania bispinosa]|nr:hypothetical protein SESBI_04786 [Sesbania bispinosa]
MKKRSVDLEHPSAHIPTSKALEHTFPALAEKQDVASSTKYVGSYRNKSEIGGFFNGGGGKG